MTPGQLTGTVIVGTGMVMAIAGLIVLAAVDPLVGGVLFVVGVSDVVVGMMFRSGRLGSQASPAETEAEQSIAAENLQANEEANAAAYGTTADGAPISGDANPYARED